MYHTGFRNAASNKSQDKLEEGVMGRECELTTKGKKGRGKGSELGPSAQELLETCF